MDAGVLPVKHLKEAKRRLEGAFTPDERAEIARALLDDALQLCRSSAFLRWWVVSPDVEVLGVARAAGFETIEDPGRGLNEALARAAAELRDAGATSMTVVPGDVPLAFSGDLQDLVDTGATSDVVVVPSGDGGGTNALYVSPPDVMEPRFGPGSLTAHLAAATASGHRCSILNLPRLALDVDTPRDVRDLLMRDRRGDSATVQLLRRLRPAGVDA